MDDEYALKEEVKVKNDLKEEEEEEEDEQKEVVKN